MAGTTAATWRGSCAPRFRCSPLFKEADSWVLLRNALKKPRVSLTSGWRPDSHGAAEAIAPASDRPPSHLSRSNLSSPASAGQNARTFSPSRPGRAALCRRIRPANQRAGGRAEGAWSPEAAASLHECSGREPLGGAESHGTDGGGERPGGRLQSSVGTVRR